MRKILVVAVALFVLAPLPAVAQALVGDGTGLLYDRTDDLGLADHGVAAVLVGESLMRAADQSAASSQSSPLRTVRRCSTAPARLWL